MVRNVKRFFLKRKINRLEIKHRKLLNKAQSANLHHKGDSEVYSKRAHIIENRIEKLKSRL
jgi:hypothetical protein